MKTTSTTSTLKKVLLIATLVMGPAFLIINWPAPRVQAIQDSEDRPNPFGSLELAPGQSARLNVVSIQPPPEHDTRSPRPDPSIARRVRLAFDVYVQDEENTPACGGIPTCLVRYRFLRRELREVELMPGQAASLNFTASAGAKIQAFIQTVGNPNEVGNPNDTPEPHLVPSLEVREGTRTLFVVPALARFFNPQPDPPGHQR